MSLKDHGVPEEDIKKLMEYCRNDDAEVRYILNQAILSTSPGIRNEIYKSLTVADKQRGYETLSKKSYIPASKADFYAYRRKALAEFYRLLRLLGKWEEE